MGPNETGLDKGFKADVAIPQFRVVHLTDIENMTLADGSAELLGVCQEEVEERDAGLRVAAVRMEGITRAVAGAAVGLREYVTVDATGRVVPLSGANQLVVGQILTPTGAADRYVDLWLKIGLLRSA